MYPGLFNSRKEIETLDIEELRDRVLSRDLPEHIAIIMDGNGRWAKKRGLPRKAGHKNGVRRLKEIVKIVKKLGIKYLTVFAFSTENWERPEKEVNFLMKLFSRTLDNDAKELHEQGVKIRVLGRQKGLPTEIKNKVENIIELTKRNQALNLNIALNYGGRAEIVDATKELITKVQEEVLDLDEIDERILSKELYTKDIPDPQLLIRPSGEMRISNFLLWQLAYTEFWFTSTLWPDFSEEDLLLAIADYQSRERRFGGLKD
ncbi:undecaprenyl diphosphate synthase [Selenihalanaerobacter shriftii]|uniref:Isoprenyl transferase n=2 Tax=Selenihalanaerobacter shriftii TaxID=142842 RepID=A0A1T4MDF7_9FIRM|nr:undecaprenyl diphosphate synthase [Selenihalanaerobacter shriftii]